MKAKLVPGADLEFVTPDELHDILQRLKANQPITVRAPESFTSDANGDIGVTADAPVFQVPVGFEFRVHIVRVACDGHANAAQNVQHAGAFYQLLIGDQPVDDVALDAAVTVQPVAAVPFTRTAARDQGPVARNGELVKVVVKGLTVPAQTKYQVFVQGTLVRAEQALAEPA